MRPASVDAAQLPPRSAFRRFIDIVMRLGSRCSTIGGRNSRREAGIASRYEGCRWCDSVERQLNDACVRDQRPFNPYREQDW
jgi:hypothetical protein